MNQKTMVKLTTAMDKLFKRRTPLDDIEPRDNAVAFMDTANVLMVEWLDDSMVDWFYKNYDVTNISRVPELDFSNGGMCKYNTDYCKKIFSLFGAFPYESFKIEMARDYPMRITFYDGESEKDMLRIYLAPRVENN